MLELDQIRSVVSDMWAIHQQEIGWLDRIYEYTKGLRGRPDLPEGAGEELKELAKLAILNVLGAVRDGFDQNLSVVGFRGANSPDNDPAWASWQRNRMDARQHEVHRPAINYGASYVTLLPGADKRPVWRARSPRQLLAVYDDPQIDQWPQYAMESWIAFKDAKPHRRGLLYGETHAYPLDLGWVPLDAEADRRRLTQPPSVVDVDEPIEHGATFDGKPVCPVVRFVNDRDADDMIVGEIAPLIQTQQSINNVNFDRLIASRWGVFPQKVITGWTGTKTEVARASSMRVWTFDDDDVRVQSFPAGSVEPYNSVLAKLLGHVAMVSGLSLIELDGQLINVGPDTVAMADKKKQLKLAAKRDSFGESWEQVFRLDAAMDDDPETAADTKAEVIWRDTESRSFAAVVDGISKLQGSGVPIEELIDYLPGMTQQRANALRKSIRAGKSSSLVDKLIAAQPAPVPPPPVGIAEQAAQQAVNGGTGGS